MIRNNWKKLVGARKDDALVERSQELMHLNKGPHH